MMRWLVGMVIAAVSTSAWAQDVALPNLDLVPAAPDASRPEELPIESASDIDLANVVTSAAKSVTTVQEVPSIVTVITDAACASSIKRCRRCRAGWSRRSTAARCRCRWCAASSKPR
jgi:hypothetical protein